MAAPTSCPIESASSSVLPHWELRSLVSTIPAQVRLLIIDACASGALIRRKGAAVAAPFALPGPSLEGQVILTAAGPAEPAQEWDALGGALFTHNLVSALRGAGDADGDGDVTLFEAYSYAYERTLALSTTALLGPQHRRESLPHRARRAAPGRRGARRERGPGRRDGGDDPGGAGDDGGAIPTEHAEGVLVAFDDRDGDGDGQLDLCSEATCTDVVLGASNPSAPFLTAGVLRADPDAEGGWSIVDAAYPAAPVALVYVDDAWKPYGVREIPAGYAVWRTDADVAAGERFLDTFDPAIDIEVPLVESPSLDELSCDGGCMVRFATGAPDCPDLETSWCTLRPELPPEGVSYHLVDCAETSTGETVCFPVWDKYTITGCTRRYERWNGCPVDYDSVPNDPDPDPAAWDWSCLDPT